MLSRLYSHLDRQTQFTIVDGERVVDIPATIGENHERAIQNQVEFLVPKALIKNWMNKDRGLGRKLASSPVNIVQWGVDILCCYPRTFRNAVIDPLMWLAIDYIEQPPQKGAPLTKALPPPPAD